MRVKEKVFPNFWQALLVISCYILICTIIQVGAGLIIKGSNHSYLFEVIQIIIQFLIFVLLILFVIKKSNIKILNYFSVPDLVSLFRLIIITLLIEFILTIPLDKPNQFFDSLINLKIRLIGSSIRKLHIIYDIRSIFLIPVVEEILFRGLILKQFLKQYSTVKAILLSSLLFSFYHEDPINFVNHCVFGIFVGLIYYKSGSVLVTSIVHIISNSICILRWEYIDITPLNITLLVSFYIISVLAVVYLLRMPIKTVKISALVQCLNSAKNRTERE